LFRLMVGELQAALPSHDLHVCMDRLAFLRPEVLPCLRVYVGFT
jgi:hypothetical protein